MDPRAAHHLEGEAARVVVHGLSEAEALLVDDAKKEYTFSRKLLPHNISVGDRLVIIIEHEHQARAHQAMLAKELLSELLQDIDEKT